MTQLDISKSNVTVPNEPSIYGLKRTNKSHLQKFTHNLNHNKVNDFDSALKYSVKYKKALEKTGLFSKVTVEINTDEINSDNVEISCNVVEKNMSINAGIDDLTNPSAIKGVVNFSLFNIFGNGESLELKTDKPASEAVQVRNFGISIPNDYKLSFSKPIVNIKNNNKVQNLNFHYQNQIIDNTWVNSKERNNGVGIGIGLRGSENMTHSLNYEFTERHLRTKSNILAMSVREQLGHSLKSSISYNYNFNGIKTTNSSKSKSKNGAATNASIELAGLYGTSQFLKWNLQRTHYKTFENLILSLVLKCGHVVGPNIELQDRLYLGGPMDLRGYDFNEASPKEGCNKCVGIGLHAYLPLTQGFDIHTFATSGAAFDEFDKAKKNIKTSIGAGISYDLSSMGINAAIEINNIYKVEENKNRIQMGIGFGTL